MSKPTTDDTICAVEVRLTPEKDQLALFEIVLSHPYGMRIDLRAQPSNTCVMYIYPATGTIELPHGMTTEGSRRRYSVALVVDALADLVEHRMEKHVDNAGPKAVVGGLPTADGGTVQPVTGGLPPFDGGTP